MSLGPPAGAHGSPGVAGRGDGRGAAAPQNNARRSSSRGCPNLWPPMHAHLWLSCLHSHARFFGPHSPKGQSKDFSLMQLFQGFLSRGSGQGASHELWPWSLPLQKAGTVVSASAESSSGESLWPVLQHHCRSRRGFGRSSVPSQTFSLSPPPRRLSPPPVLLRRQPPPTSSPGRALRAPPSPWKFPRRPGTAILPLASPPHRPGPSLPPCPSQRRKEFALIS